MEELIGTVSAYLAAGSLVQLTVTAHDHEWVRLVARPMPKQVLRVDFKGPQGTSTQTISPNELLGHLSGLEHSKLISATLKVKSGQLFFNRNKDGQLVKTKNYDSVSDAVPHDEEPGQYVFSPRALPGFFQGLGIATQSNAVKAEKYKKFRQINEFIRIQKPYLAALPAARLLTLDFGCGNAYLTVAWHYFLTRLEGRQAETIGVDRRPEPVEKLNQLAKLDELAGLSFVRSEILQYRRAPQWDETRIIFALHACDTATDEALVQSIRCDAQLVVLAPCCHHDLQKQLKGKNPIKPLRHLYRHGIMRERLGDLVTDDLRAQILLLYGYKVDVFQFIDSEHTMKNIMIVAHSRSSEPQTALDAYRDCKKFWGVEPQAEILLREAELWIQH